MAKKDGGQYLFDALIAVVVLAWIFSVLAVHPRVEERKDTDVQPIKPITKIWFVDVCILLAMAGIAGLLCYGDVRLAWWGFGRSVFVGACLSVILVGPFVLGAVYAASSIECACRRIVGQFRKER